MFHGIHQTVQICCQKFLPFLVASKAIQILKQRGKLFCQQRLGVIYSHASAPFPVDTCHYSGKRPLFRDGTLKVESECAVKDQAARVSKSEASSRTPARGSAAAHTSMENNEQTGFPRAFPSGGLPGGIRSVRWPASALFLLGSLKQQK